MAHDWIIDVLTDLKAFANANGLPALAERLEETNIVAQIEIASQTKGAGIGLCSNDVAVGRNLRGAGMR